MNIIRYIVIIVSILIAVVSAPGAAYSQDTATTRGAELLAPLKKNLKQALVTGMQKGPLHAISECKIQAPAIADALSIEGVRIGRTSHRLRNQSNVAPGWVDAVLEKYVAGEVDRAPKVVRLADSREGYVEPITIKPLCLACHGENLAPEVAERINVMYPHDAATGFANDDFRGVFWVEYPVE